jgi:hypothetical protein
MNRMHHLLATSLIALGSMSTWPSSAAPADAPVTQAKQAAHSVAGSTALEDSPGAFVRAIRSSEFEHFVGPVRTDAGRVVFSHYDQTGNSYNVVALTISDGGSRNLVERVPGGQFVAEDARYLVYSSQGSNANPLVVFDKRANKRVSTVRLRNAISWGHVHGNRLILVQGGIARSTTATALVYRLPELTLEHSAEIIGGNETALWGDRIVSVGYQLGIYDLSLREIAVVDIPRPDANINANCGGGPLVVAGDKAVVGANCARLAVVDLPGARIERFIPMASLFQSFAVSEGLIFAVDPGGRAPDVRVIELSTGRELARIGIDASFLVMEGKSLLAMKRKDFSTPVRFTSYEVDLDLVRSEAARMARATSGCGNAERVLAQQGDLHAALDACERAGIKSYVDEASIHPDMRHALETYALWLTLSLSRYSEGAAIYERLHPDTRGGRFDSQRSMAKRKALYLELPSKDSPPSSAPEPKGVARVPVDFGAFNGMIKFEGDRIYIARWACGESADPGVTLDVLERQTFQRITSVPIAPCDDTQQDSITAIGFVPGYIVLGLGYRYEEADRPTVAVDDTRSLEVVNRRFIRQEVASLGRWQSRLLACSRSSGQPHLRFDASSARLVPASEDEARACANGDPVQIGPMESSVPASDAAPVAQTARYRVFAAARGAPSTFRIVQKPGAAKRDIRLPERQYTEVLAVPGRDALLLRYASGERTRFAYFDIDRQTDVVLFELGRSGATSIWGQYFFVTLGRDLLVYDLERRVVVSYERDLIREGFVSNCCGVDRNRIDRLIVDEDRLLALTFDGFNSRVIDLAAYTSGLVARDFFMTPGEK